MVFKDFRNLVDKKYVPRFWFVLQKKTLRDVTVTCQLTSHPSYPLPLTGKALYSVDSMFRTSRGELC